MLRSRYVDIKSTQQLAEKLHSLPPWRVKITCAFLRTIMTTIANTTQIKPAARSLENLAAFLKGRVIGDGSISIRSINSVDTAGEGEITFAEDARKLAQALASKASGIIVEASVTALNGRSGISVKDPKLAFALLLQLYYPEPESTGVIHPTAVISKDAQIGERVDVRANAYIGDRARIGRGTIIEPGVYIGEDVTIGENTWIGPGVAIYRRCVIGSRVRLHAGVVIGGDGFGYVFHEGRYVKVPQVGNTILEDDVELGCNACVDRATTGSTIIGHGTKLDNLVQVGHNIRIGHDAILTGQVGLAGSVTIGNYCMLGGKVGVVDHIVVADGTRVGAGSLVTRDSAPGDFLLGYPARPMKRAKEQMAAVGRLPEMRKRLLELEARIKELEKRSAS